MSGTRAPGSAEAWTAVIPIKAWAKAKSRLEGSQEARAEFARALALDTLEVVAASPMVGWMVVVTSEPELADVRVSIPATVVLDERQSGSQDPLNGAIRSARDWAITHAKRSPIVVIPADLPALTTTDLDAALQQLGWFDRTHIPDHRGQGTTLSAARRPALLEPRYGPASKCAHAAVGSVPIVDVEPGVRLDVDCLDDLAGAAVLGLGRRTRGIHFGRELALIGPRIDSLMQATQGEIQESPKM